MNHATFYTFIALVAIGLHGGLAAYCLTSRPRRAINYVFAALSISTVYYYVASLQLLVDPTNVVTAIPPIFRWKWIAVMLFPTLYFHLISFFFIDHWKRWSKIILGVLYLLVVVAAGLTLFTDLLIAGILPPMPGYILSPKLTPLAYPFLGSALLVYLAGSIGIYNSLRVAISPSLREQARTLLIPVLLQLVAAFMSITSLVASDTKLLFGELDDLLLIVSGVFFGRMIVGYGFIGGRPQVFNRILQALIITTALLACSYAVVYWDIHLGHLDRYNYPVLTGMLILFVVILHIIPTTAQGSLTDRLRKASPKEHGRQLAEIVQAIETTPAVAELKFELLGVLCRSLKAVGGGLAYPLGKIEAGVSKETETQEGKQGRNYVRVKVAQVFGHSPVELDQIVYIPKEASKRSMALATMNDLDKPTLESDGIRLFCPVFKEGNLAAIFLLGERLDFHPFDGMDLVMSEDILRHWQVIEQINAFDEQLHEAVIMAANRTKKIAEITPGQFAETTPREVQAPACEIRTLGALEIRQGSQPAADTEWGSEKAKGMLAYLIWKGRSGASREEICATLWPEKDDPEAANVFHVTLHNLRRALEPGLSSGRSSSYIQRTGDCYRLVENGLQIDSNRFEALVKLGDRQSLQEAARLYRGPYMEGVEWALPVQVSAHRRYLEILHEEALRKLAGLLDFKSAEPYLLRLLASEPIDEQANRSLIEGYLRQGSRRLAQQQLERWQAAYQEMELEPGAETLTVWQSIANKVH